MANNVAFSCALVLMLAGPSACVSTSGARTFHQNAMDNTFSANPIRRVVSMLQMMGKKVEAEGEKEKELYDKFMCYCKTSSGDLAASISANTAKVPALQSDIEESEAQLATTKQELEQHQVDRDTAKSKMAQATAIREKDHAAFLKEEGNLKMNVDALSKAIPAIENGMAGGFLQTNAAALVRKVASTDYQLSDVDRDALSAFLEGGTSGDEEYAPQAGQIVGILKQLKDEMDKDLGGLISQEEASLKTYDELMAAMTKEVEAHTVAIEKKSILVGELSVNIVTMKNDLTDSEEALIEDQKFLADLGKNCALKTKEWDERCKTRSEELLAISETIKILNDDDALELFKKTLPTPSLLQVRMSTDTVRRRALEVLRAMKREGHMRPMEVDFVELALGSSKVDFTKVIKMIDDMVVHLAKEQADDEHKKEYCQMQLDMTEDKAKELQHSIDDLDTTIAEQEESIKTLAEEIKALQDGIAALDKSVAEATQQRKEENEEYTATMASNTAAKELIEFAKNRMQKFYNPKLYKAPPKRELTEEERVYANMGGEVPAVFTQVASVHTLKKDAPPPPPEATFGGAKTEESGGVLAMMDNLVRDLDKEMTEATAEEKDAQGDYEEMMADAAAKRGEDAKSITEKESAKADAETDHGSSTGTHKETTEELSATKQYLGDLHGDCDWLLQNFDLRKTARADETDALKKAKAVLSGADFSLVQVGAFIHEH